MSRVKTFVADGSNPNGRLFAGDLNAIQDQYADLYNLAQSLGVSLVSIGESGLQLLRYGAGEARLSGALRTDGIIRGLGGLYPGAFTTTQRDAIATGLAPYGLVILNTTTNRYEWNQGTDSARSWQPLGNTLSSGTGTLAARPAANAVTAGSTYFATDQVVDYVSDGTNWLRKGIPAGVTVEWHSSAAVPTGWVPYDGSNLPASTGIYASLYAHLGNTLTTPDTRGRITVAQGTHADVTTIGANDGVAVNNRRPKHNHTLTGAPALGTLAVTGAPAIGTLAVSGAPAIGTLAVTGAPAIGTLALSGAPGVGSLALPDHAHSLTATGFTLNGGSGSGQSQATLDGSNGSGTPTGWSVNNPTSHPAITGAPTIGTLAVGGAPAIGSLAVGGAPAIGTLAVSGAPAIGSLAVGGAPSVGTLAVGPGGTTAVDSAAYIVALKIAKL